MKVYRFFLFLSLFFLITLSLFAQEAETETEAESEEIPILIEDPLTEEVEILSGERLRIDMEIRTSTLPELAVWCRSLGLSESGTREALSTRLREHFELPGGSVPENQKVITIESAQTSEYFRIEVIDEDYARLRGNVKLTLKDGDSTHNIRAEEILFNRTRNILTARGGVVYEKESGDAANRVTETFRGETITVNLDDWSSVFLDGQSERAMGTEGTAYLFSGTVISRSGEDVTVLNDASLSSANNPEALWSISASKIWLLPGTDFAILNAVLKVGEIPVLYIPFFFYAADEQIVHPVIGYRRREGGFIQTTTYILGRPKVDPADTSSITRILGNANDMEKERHGVFLRSTGKKAVDTTEISLKAMLDYYINLGAYLGFDLTLPKTSILNPVELSFGVGFTRTISQYGNGYYFSPYYLNNTFTGESDWNSSNFFAFQVPFRYRFEFKSGFSGKYGSLNWEFPYYSDPYVKLDFLNRAESVDWFNLMTDPTTDYSRPNEISMYRWHITGSLNPSFTSLAPYISRITISTISTTLQFKSIMDYEISANNRYSPGLYFYGPDLYTIYNFSASIAGTPLTIGGAAQKSTGGTETTVEIDDPLEGIGMPIAPWADDENTSAKIKSDDILSPPVLAQKFEGPVIGNIKFDMDYTLSPTGSSELQFMSTQTNWPSYDQVNWNDVQSVLTSFSGRGDLNFNLNHSSGLFTNRVTFSGSGTWRDYTFLNEEAEKFLNSDGDTDQSKVDDERRQIYSQTSYTSSYAYTGTLRPLYQNQIFRQSSLQYGFRGTLVRSRKHSGGDGPELTPEWGSWEKERTDPVTGKFIPGLTGHNLSANLSAGIFDKQQSLTVTTHLPPLDPLVESSLAFRFWISETLFNMRMNKPENSEKWIFNPFNITENLRFHARSNFRYYMVIDPEKDYDITTITSTLTLWDFTASFRAEKTTQYDFVIDAAGGRWTAKPGEPELIPKSLNLTYNHKFSDISLINNRINFSADINTAANFDLQMHTNSNFSLTLGFNFTVPGLLDLSIKARTVNNVIFRYFKGFPGMEDLTFMYPDGPQNNIFIDLLDSFNFFDDTKRRRSGFKMSDLELTATHHLGDWKAVFEMRIYPYQAEYRPPESSVAIPRWEFTADISIYVQWSPISEIKSEMSYKGETDRWQRN